MFTAARRYSIKSLPFELQPKNKYNAARSAFNFKPKPTQGLIHNPPAAMPSLKDTPRTFLPANDPRLTIMADKYRTYTPEELNDMPLIYGISKEKDYSLTPEIVEKIVKLRNEDQDKWTISRLAAEFKIDARKVNVITGVNKEKQQKLVRELEALKQTWAEKKLAAKLDRSKRTDMWLRNEF